MLVLYDLFKSLNICSKKASIPLNITFQLRMASQISGLRYLTQVEASSLDQELFNEYAFSVDQLMELAGLSVAAAVAKSYPAINHDKPIICCGPGNNGGDGLVAARHLKLFGYLPTVICPKPAKSQLYRNLMIQCEKFEIPIFDRLLDETGQHCNLIIDSVFGFSYKPPNRSKEFASLLTAMHYRSRKVPLVSVDIPSGWHVESGPPTIETNQIEAALQIPALQPDCLISLTAPKLCAKQFQGRFHYLGGRFCPPNIQKKYSLNLPEYPGTEGVSLL